MSRCVIEQSGGQSPDVFESIQTVNLYESSAEAINATELELQRNRITRVQIALGKDGFEELSRRFDDCISVAEDILASSYHLVDSRYGHTAGYYRKERSMDENWVQVEDPKNVFQFNEQARVRWLDQFALAPLAIKSFMELGYEVHQALSDSAKKAVAELDINRSGLLEEHFPIGRLAVSFMRIVRYDSYENDPSKLLLPVAKPHVDICSYTVQGWSSAPGFWGRTLQGKEYFDDQADDGFFFASRTHEKMFGKNSSIAPLIHGVDRIVPSDDMEIVPARTAVVLFVNPWRIDPGVTSVDTKAA